MYVVEIIQANFLTPMPLFFVLGLLATLIRSDLKVPEPIYIGMTLYLLAAIGLKGGAEIRAAGLTTIWIAGLACIAMGMLIPCLAFATLRYVGRFNSYDAAAIAGHYGSVSAVTFAVATEFLQSLNIFHEEYASAFLAVLEPIGVVTGILLARIFESVPVASTTPSRGPWLSTVIHEALTGKGSMILLGALVIGYATGQKGISMTSAFFNAPFKGVLCLFMLEMGLVAAQRLQDVRKVGVFLIAFGVLMPILNGFLGAWAGSLLGLSLGGATLFAVLMASASYIAAPAAMRVSVPQANPSLYLTAALGITFPFNIIGGIPLYYWFAQILEGN
jgi:hypothetical protein